MVESIFENTIEVTLSVSSVIILLLIFSKVLDKNYTAKWRYWVWLVLAIRLILPFNITISDPPLNLSAPEMTKLMGTLSNGHNVQTVQTGEVRKTQEEAAPVTGQVNENNSVLLKVENVYSQTSGTNNLDLAGILTNLWIAGITIFLMYQLMIYFLYRKKVKPWCMVVREQELLNTYGNICEELNIVKTIPIMTCKIVKSPMVIGLWNPVLLLPDMAFPLSHMRMILRHELIHVKRRDILYKILILLARAVHWFNPLVHLMAIEANKDIELSCDAAVVENQNVDYRKNYSEAILSVIHKGNTTKAVFSTYFGGGKKMLKKRFASLFDLRRKRKGIISLMMVVLILGIIGLCISCTQKADSNLEDKILYQNKTLGFSLQFPKDWRDKYIVEEADNNIAIYCKKVYEKYKGLGLLFTINRMTGELITEEDMRREPVRQQIVLQGNGYTYFTRQPSDMQYPPDDKAVSGDYLAMSEQISDVSQWMALLGNQKPKAANEGFKVVGSSFFTVEMPSDWELKVLQEFPLSWHLYAGDNQVGKIELIPYKSEGVGETAANNQLMREYLFNDEAFREMRITLNQGYTDKATMEKIKNSFVFTGGPYNVVDLQSAGKEYLARGGKTVFGQILDFQMENGEQGNPVAVRVKLMKFISDGPGEESPNGFRIEDLHQTETYSWDFKGGNAPIVAPLAAPNYVTYNIYELPLLDENLIKKYANYKDFFYDFIIGSDGELKIVLGHYVP